MLQIVFSMMGILTASLVILTMYSHLRLNALLLSPVMQILPAKPAHIIII